MNASALPFANLLPQNPRSRRIVLILWILAFAAMPVWMAFDPPGWDLDVCYAAIHSLAAGHDPYADSIAILQRFHDQIALHPSATPPFIYVYPPITLLLLRVIGALPSGLSAALYWLTYLAAVLTQIWVGMQAIEESESRYFVYLAPVAPFFPGLLADGTALSGNIAHILYALILLAAVAGWKRGNWHWFYLVTFVASCVKLPFLTLLAIPVLSARKKWLPVAITAAAGVALFAIQSSIWPSLFKHYLQATELMFRYSRDFGCSPAGLFSDFLYGRGIPYSPGGIIFYLCYAVPLFGFLLYLSGHFLRGSFSLKQWLPVLLVGVILLNPRLIEYDVAPLALPLTLIGWRFLSSFLNRRLAIVFFSLFFAATNSVAVHRWALRKAMDGLLLVLFFIAGSWILLQLSRKPSTADAIAPELALSAP